MEMVSQLNASVRTLAMVGLRSRFPTANDIELPKEWIYFSSEKSECSFSIKLTQGNKSDVESAIKLVQDKNSPKKSISKKRSKSTKKS